jgi:hypothetical protein
LLSHKQASLAVYRKVLTVILEQTVASETIGQQVVGTADNDLIGISGSKRAGPSSRLGKE